MADDRSRRIVLAGAGHAHLGVAREARRFTRLGVELTLVDPGEFWYSGLATGMLGGMYEAGEDRVDPQSLIETNGGRFLRGRISGLDRRSRIVHLEDGRRLGYEALSFNVGSEIAVPPGLTGAWKVKPIANLWELRGALEKRMRERHTAHPLRVIVVGGGATGCEIAANVDVLARRNGSGLRLTLVTRASRLLPEAPAAAARRLTRVLRKRGTRLEFNCEVVHMEDGSALTGDGRTLPYDEAVLATGLKPPDMMAGLGLPVGPGGGLLVDRTLRSVSDERVLGAGDCISLEGHELSRLGVHAVRQTPILQHNLLATITGEAIERYSPRRHCLRILNLGDRALALWGPLHWLGSPALWIKDIIDRRFLARHRAGAGHRPGSGLLG